MSLTNVVAFASLVVAANAMQFTWNGRPSSFSDELNWGGSSPLAAPGPSKMSLGKAGSSSYTTTGADGQFFVGNKLIFDGPTQISLEGSTGFELVFNQNDKTSRPATFVPEGDATCNQNWLVKRGSEMVGAPRVPCGRDTIVIPDDKTYFVEFGAGQSINSIQFGTTSQKVRSCNGETFISQVGTSSGVALPVPCDDSILGSKVSPTCSIDTSCTTTTTTTTTTTSTTITIVPEASSSDAAAATTIIVIVVVVCVLLIVIIAVFAMMIMRRGKASNENDRSVQSFENPLYDEVDEDKPAAGGDGANGYMDVPSDGLYDEPDLPDPSATGYMDVPAGDKTATVGSGYMDVSPEEFDGNDDEDDEDEESEDEDI